MSSTVPPDLDAFLASYGDTLGRLAYHLTGDREAALDLLQDSLVRLLGRWDRVTAADHPLAYVRRVVVNQHLNATRRRPPTARDRIDGTAPDGASAYDELDAMWRALRTLTDRQRAVLVLRHYEGCSDEEIGQVLGCRRATVRSLAARGLAQLRESPHLQDRADTGSVS